MVAVISWANPFEGHVIMSSEIITRHDLWLEEYKKLPLKVIPLKQECAQYQCIDSLQIQYIVIVHQHSNASS